MIWDENEPNEIRKARLLISPANIVYEQLKVYGAYLQQTSVFSRNADFETVLFNRNEPLINLGLAQYCSSSDIVYELYNRSCIPCGLESENIYNHGLRVACFANQSLNRWVDWDRLIQKIDLKPLFQERAYEAYTLVKNPSIPPYTLASIYERTKEFSDLDDITWLSFINASSDNPRLNIDETDYKKEYLDEGHIVVHNAILKVLETAPLSEQCINLIGDLFYKLNPDLVKASRKIDSILERWAFKNISSYHSDNSTYKEGYYTNLSLIEEFRCLIASLYGGVSNFLVARDAEDIAFRCIYYGNSDMTIQEMNRAYELDADVFSFAALNNSKLFKDKRKRILIEKSLNERLEYRYKRRCEEIHTKDQDFDPNPIMEQGYSDDEYLETPPELLSLEILSSKLDELSLQLNSVKLRVFIGFSFIGLLIVFSINLGGY
jgi:hypothetical protein